MCDTLVVVGPDGVHFAKNSDRDANEAQVLDWRPPRTWPAGSRVRCTWIEIPQATETSAVLLSRPFWMWGAEMGANAHGVVIGNEAVFTRQPLRREGGLTGMDLVRLGLERADTAARAVEVIVDLLDTHGQGGGCGHEDRRFTYHNSFLVADAREAWVVETAGVLRAVERVTAGVRSLSNALTIDGFAQRHGDPLRAHVACARRRRARTARARGDIRNLFETLRDHGPAPRYGLLSGGMGAPCMHAGGLLVSAQTTASWVAHLRPGDARHWVTATAAPCLSLFKPVRVDEPLALAPATDRADEASLWWRHERLHRRVMRDPERLAPLFTRERDAVEARWLARPPSPAEAFAEHARLLSGWLAAVPPGRDTRPPWTRRYWRLRDARAGLASPG